MKTYTCRRCGRNDFPNPGMVRAHVAWQHGVYQPASELTRLRQSVSQHRVWSERQRRKILAARLAIALGTLLVERRKDGQS